MSVETERRDLRSFQHCKKDVDLVCFTLPELCPLCQQSTSTTEMRIPPYLLPSPFCSSKKTLCSVVLRPTCGDFFRGYSRTCNLHIGVTDSQGYVYDYDEKGLHQRSIWPECLVVISNTCMDPVLWEYNVTAYLWTVRFMAGIQVQRNGMELF
ncbi:MKRN2 opposite strand protein-like [Physella acuta]|uniref:MKRN2 opposite strand protein-like n=1 Tax=Physella acuta TaxID=109671 RepID=UPI0027DB5830|nr:MKRN2 opposite strand protein-like [Physella acuta]